MALLNPLKQSFLPGNFPALVAKLTVPSDEIDVNVHPTKTEIRFLDSSKIFTLCNAAIKRMLDEANYSPAFQSSPYSLEPQNSGRPAYFSGYQRDTAFTPMLNLEPTQSATFSSSGPSFVDSTPYGEYRGVLFSTYFVFERGDDLTLVDQHAAHERVRYEKLKKRILNGDQIERQALLVPEVVKLSAEKCDEVKPKLTWLESLGFEVEAFSEESILFRAIPAVWGNLALAPRLKNLIERLIDTEVASKNLTWDETLFEKIAMEACRSSFKAGDVVFESSALDLTQKLLECEHPGNCPHGRPTTVRISKTKVEEWFNRLS
jgi:DNA mismatch repair protein MutL